MTTVSIGLGLRPIRLSAIELIRLYVPYFANPADPHDAHWRGQPIASGHERNGSQVFWPYHWIIRGDGTAERLLYDSEIGWHAGDWAVNCRSVGIVFDDDLESREPAEIQLRGAASLIAEQYPNVPISRIFGHHEITSKTECPSRWFLAGPWGHGWKRRLLMYVRDAERMAA
jgi:N-acetyl-anhydromuramyl-L-alanine amidase AmpD